jgi:uncharacterized protein YjbJ (UPF0337 family)
MNMDIVQGKWRQWIGFLQQRVAKRKNDDLEHLEGSRNQLIGLLQERKGYAREGRKRRGERPRKGFAPVRYSDSYAR